jgi:glycerol-3-phosphate dehydrogenase
MSGDPATYDLLVVGGGINGAGIARDGSGRCYASSTTLRRIHRRPAPS